MRANLIASEIGIGLRRNLLMTFAVVLVSFVSLVLVGGAYLARQQVNLMKGFWYDKVEVSIFLCSSTSQSPSCQGKAVTQDERASILADLEATPEVKKVYYESQHQAYERFKEQFKDSPDLVRNVSPDALPESYRVKLKDPTQFAVIQSKFANEPGVDQVTDQRALLERFFKFLNGLTKGAYIGAGLLLVAAALLIFNAIRVAAFSRRRETGIMRLVGASDLFIQLPFLLEGAVAGLVGSLLACGGLALIKTFFIDAVLKKAITFTPFLGWDDVLLAYPLIIVIGVVLSATASFVSLRRYLRV